MIIGVLALQGAFREHIHMIKKCDAGAVEIRLPAQLDNIDGLIIPGGESTTISKLMMEYDFLDRLKSFAVSGRPIFGTCAGAILLADKVGGKKQDLLNLIDIDVKRNAYGPQVYSREAEITVEFPEPEIFRAVFIRAPIIDSIGSHVIPLALYNNTYVMVRQDNILVSTFHPELTEDSRIHQYFLRMINHKQQITWKQNEFLRVQKI
ncbi:MAG: pyridoxal 5'-phosphate synthase glutaminase subunit PdxT [Deltaproteobacteria bacterium]|nr:pyridoxal 5'-phosphate synthase glutaminase subunit PdxT [Deltaproteobacteria bacterium]